MYHLVAKRSCRLHKITVFQKPIPLFRPMIMNRTEGEAAIFPGIPYIGNFGTKMKHAQKKKNYCKECGHRIPANAGRCPHCGIKIKPRKKHPVLRGITIVTILLLCTVLVLAIFCKDQKETVLKDAKPANLETILIQCAEDEELARETYLGNNYVVSGFVSGICNNRCYLHPSGGNPNDNVFVVYLSDNDIARVSTGAPVTVVGHITETGRTTCMNPAYLK